MATRVTQIGVLAEQSGSGVRAAQVAALVEIGGVGVYVTEVGALIEIEYVEPAEVVVPTYFPSAAGSRAIHHILPDEVTGYAFDPEYSWWSAIIPIASENLVVNCSFELDDQLTNHYATGAAIYAREDNSPVGTIAGIRCAKLTLAGGGNAVFSQGPTGITVTPGQYTFSVYLYPMRQPLTLQMQIYDSGPTLMAQRQFELTTSGWQRLEMPWVCLASGTVTLHLRFPDSNGANVVYSDGWQFERQPAATTYFDGDMLGWYDTGPNQSYFWRGLPHLSPAVRNATTGSGGKIVSFNEQYQFYTTGIVGLGMAPVEHRTLSASDGEEFFIRSDFRPRDFTITGRIFGKNFQHTARARQELIELLRPNATRGREPLILRYQPVDSRGRIIGIPLDIVCAYRDGLQGNITNFYQESIGLQFHASQPFLTESIDTTLAFDFHEELTTQHVFYRNENGEWGTFTTGAETVGSIEDIVWSVEGQPIVAGDFTQMGGDSVNQIAKFDGTNWVQLGGSTFDDIVWAIYSSDEYDGKIMVGGDFQNYGANPCLYAAIYDEGTDSWSQPGTGFNDDVFVVTRGFGRYWYLGGAFTGDGASAILSPGDPGFYGYVARYDEDTDTVTPLAAGLDDYVRTILVGDRNGQVYIGGDFAFGYHPVNLPEAMQAVAQWNGITNEWVRMGSGLIPGKVTQLLYGPDNMIYAAGTFEQDGDALSDLRGFARWNGVAWEEVFDLNSLNDETNENVNFVKVKLDANGVFWFWNPYGGTFTLPDFGTCQVFGWANGIFYPQPFEFVQTGSNGVRAIAFGRRNEFLVGHNIAAAQMTHLYVPKHYTVEYAGNADARPTIQFEGLETPVLIENYTTQSPIVFRNGQVTSEEVIRIATGGFQPRIVSNNRSNARPMIATGATSLKSFRLMPGTNHLNFFARQVGAQGRNFMSWRNRYLSIDSSVGG